MSWLKERVVFITGGASGLGRDVAQAIVQIASLPPGVVVKEALVYKPGT